MNGAGGAQQICDPAAGKLGSHDHDAGEGPGGVHGWLWLQQWVPHAMRLARQLAKERMKVRCELWWELRGALGSP